MESRVLSKNVLVVFGVSGVGKSSVMYGLLKDEPSLRRIISCTTRSPRVGEQNGLDYHFISSERMSEIKSHNQALLYDRVYTNEYCIYQDDVDSVLNSGCDAIFACSSGMLLNGEFTRFKSVYNAVSIGIVLNSFETIQERLLMRGSDKGASLQERMQLMQKEHDIIVQNCEFCIENEVLEVCIENLKQLYRTIRERNN